MAEKLLITKKNARGTDGYKVFSVRLKEDTVDEIGRLSDVTGRTRNELIGLLLDFALANSEVVTEK
ncbi:CopG family transcriptional regulator [Selenomonas sp. AB3002]|uniref:CopG family transcriptional regulator n=1 Tax=Selenomonas sp. AB3002 TaxID=1392502 RepID=UPI000496574A